MKLTKADKELIECARQVLGKEKKVHGGVIKEVGAALLTKEGKIFTGVSLDIMCGIGFCAEHSAIADMISHSDETEIRAIVACNNSERKEILYPCGRCRELMELIDKVNRNNTDVIITENKKVKLKKLLPGEWM